MQIFVAGRAHGKTTKVISHLYAYDDAVLIVPTHQRARMLAKEHPELADRIVSATSSVGLRGRSFSKVLVDDLDAVLFHLLGAQVDLATATAEVHEPDAPTDAWDEVIENASKVYNQVYKRTGNPEFAADIARQASSWQLSDMMP